MRTVKAFIFFVFSFSFAQGQVSLNEITGRQSKIYQLIKSQGKAYPFINIMSEEDTKTLKVYVPVKRFHSDIKNVVIVLSNGQAIVKMLSKIEVRQSEIAGSMLNVFHLQMNKFDIEF